MLSLPLPTCPSARPFFSQMGETVRTPGNRCLNRDCKTHVERGKRHNRSLLIRRTRARPWSFREIALYGSSHCNFYRLRDERASNLLFAKILLKVNFVSSDISDELAKWERWGGGGESCKKPAERKTWKIRDFRKGEIKNRGAAEKNLVM